MKKKIVISLLVVCLIALSACGAAPAEQQPFDINAYKETVSEARTTIYDSGLILSNFGTYEYNYSKILGVVDESAFEAGLEWIEEKAGATKESIEADYDTVRQQYKNICLIERDSAEADKIYEEYEAMYNSYVDLYAAVTNPSGSFDAFGKTVSVASKGIDEANEALSLWLN